MEIQSKYQQVSISSLNVKGLRGNFIYSDFLSLTSNITFLCELWTKPNEINLIKDLADHSNKFLLHKSDIDQTYKRGRPFGGQSWIIDKNSKLIENSFINRRSLILAQFYFLKADLN